MRTCRLEVVGQNQPPYNLEVSASVSMVNLRLYRKGKGREGNKRNLRFENAKYHTPLHLPILPPSSLIIPKSAQLPQTTEEGKEAQLVARAVIQPLCASKRAQ